MDTDTNINDILRETIAFLESLRETQLPFALENLRVKLLARSKNTLSASIRAAGASSPDRPYLDMNSGPKSILLTRSGAGQLEEYVEKESSQKQTSHHDYYETFENGIGGGTVANRAENSASNDEERESEVLLNLYKNLPAAQVKNKCHKCGPLYKKEGKKLFLSEGRTCWIALIDAHLLIYRSERHNRPTSIHSIRGYMARPAPSLIPRDRQRSESAFEIYKPGNETLQFIARTPKDMDQWVAKVCEMGSGNEDPNHKSEERKKQIVDFPVNRKDNKRSVKSDVADGAKTQSKTKTTSKKTAAAECDDGKAPPLPARIPRRLPSLPPSASPLDYSNTIVQDEDEEDEIYHKIEDLRNEMQYQNLRKKRAAAGANERNETTRDDPDERNEGETPRENTSDGETLAEDLYDDITISRINAATSVGAQNNDRPVAANDDETQEDLYDDVENLIPNGRLGKDRAKEDQVETSPSKPQKKSFLNRVLSRRESPGKTEKKSRASLLNVVPAVEEMPSYDDVSELKETPKEIGEFPMEEELPEYNCPPPPRPIALGETNDSNQELYDDISARREECNKNHQKSTIEATNAACNNIEVAANGCADEEIEHYQSPRSGMRVHDAARIEPHEELYDDIALLAEFRARQRDVLEMRRDNEDNRRSNSGSDKRSWNRFAANRRLPRDSNCATNETNGRTSGNESEETEDPSEGSARRNTFQKLISKMENSLARVSVRNPSSFSTGKSGSTAGNNNF